MTDPLESVDEVPVLLAGGGLVGLSTAMFLAQHGVASLAVEPLSAGSQLPRAAFFHMRTLELFRAAGIEDEVRRQSLREFELHKVGCSWSARPAGVLRTGSSSTSWVT